MKRLLIVFAVIFTLPLLAQQEDKPFKTTSLNFEISALSLQSFYGGVGGKTWLSDSFSLIASIGGGFNTEKTDPTSSSTKGKNESYSVILTLGAESHFNLKDNISPYIAFQLSGNYSNQKYLPTIIYDYTLPPTPDIKEAQNYQYNIRLAIGFGVEIWLSKRISLAGQYLLGGGYFWAKEGSTTINVLDRNKSGYTFGTSTSAIILAIYF